nr:unnamed protein product [Digitaria exilis]
MKSPHHLPRFPCPSLCLFHQAPRLPIRHLFHRGYPLPRQCDLLLHQRPDAPQAAKRGSGHQSGHIDRLRIRRPFRRHDPVHQ